MKTKPIAILCSDLHLSHRPPAARSGEESWYGAMGRTLTELNELKEELEVPIIFAGDLFDRWNSPPELINWSMDRLPHMYSIPGQHDLPNHSYWEIHRSAYKTLNTSGRIHTIPIDMPLPVTNKLVVFGFPWGQDVTPCERFEDCKNAVHLAVVHSYIWKGDHKYPGASALQEASKWKERLEGYDVAVFGDNHDPFITKVGNCTVLNNGTMMRRHANERNYKPGVGILYDDASVERHLFDTSEDVFTIPKNTKRKQVDLSQFMKELTGLFTDELDFRSAVGRYLDKKGIDDGTKSIVLECLED